MSENAPSDLQAATLPPIRHRSPWKRMASVFAFLIVAYLLVSYVMAPGFWRVFARRHPAFDSVPRITETGNRHPGDPLNVALIGSEKEVKKLLVAAKWYPADPLTLRNCLEIAEASVLRRPYEEAPVSNLYLMGRKQDLAFEKPVGDNPRQRHHVRFWRTELIDPDRRPIWVGAAIFDQRVGFSHTTGQITHHVAADIDRERDYLLQDLEQTKLLAEIFIVDDFHNVREGKNGGGDPWHTDGKLYAGVIAGDVQQ